MYPSSLGKSPCGTLSRRRFSQNVFMATSASLCTFMMSLLWGSIRGLPCVTKTDQ